MTVFVESLVGEFRIDGNFSRGEGSVGSHTTLFLVSRRIETDEEEEV